MLLPIQMITHEKNDHAFHRLTLNFTQTCKEDYFFKFRDLAPEIIESGPMCITDLFQNTLKSRAVDLSTIHYSFFEHFGGATNQNVLLLLCTAINQIDIPKLCIKGGMNVGSCPFMQNPFKNGVKSFDGAFLTKHIPTFCY